MWRIAILGMAFGTENIFMRNIPPKYERKQRNHGQERIDIRNRPYITSGTVSTSRKTNPNRAIQLARQRKKIQIRRLTYSNQFLELLSNIIYSTGRIVLSQITTISGTAEYFLSSHTG